MSRKKYILIVDDSEINRIMLREVLSPDYELMEAVNGAQALEIIKERVADIDLVLLDLIMPEMDGLTLLAELNKKNLLRKLSVMVISADLDPDDIEKAFDLGAIDYFTHPCNTRILRNRVKNVIALENARQEEIRALNALADLGDNVGASCLVDLEQDKIIKSKSRFTDFIEYDKTSYSELVKLIIDKCENSNGAERFAKEFSLESLREKINSGLMLADAQVSFNPINKVRILLRAVARLYYDNETNNRYAEILYYDYTERYIQNQLPKVLYENDYDFIGIIDVKFNTLALRKVGFADEEFNRESVMDYDVINQNMLHNHVLPIDHKKFMVSVSLSNIVNQLNIHGNYEYVISVYDANEEPRLKKFRYTYFEKNTQMILLTAEDITEISEQDLITEGYNRNGFVRFATKFLMESDESEQFDILYFDIMGLKAVNELFGIRGGDRAIKHMYDSIRNSKLEPLVVARTSSDHFVALVRRENVTNDNLIEACSDKFERDGKLITLYQRCGVYEIEDKTLSINLMSDRAKMAVSHLTNEYARPYEYYNQSMSDRYVDKNEVLGLLPEAIQNKEFEVYYQPIYSAKNDSIVAAEALVRWNHPSRGILTPGTFIPGLEENGHVSQLDLYIAKKVRDSIEQRVEQGKKVIPISINLSRMDFYDDDMMNSILDDIRYVSGLKDYCRFEITESSYVSLTETNIKSFTSIRDFGAKLLIDDFGSGYSSFNAITEYDFDVIKLDIAFVRKIGVNPKIENVIESLIDMAHNMGAEVVAEGAETKNQVDFLKRSKCDYIQGYYYSRPLPEKEFFELIVD